MAIAVMRVCLLVRAWVPGGFESILMDWVACGGARWGVDA